MKKKQLYQFYCPHCGSIHVQEKAWVDLNSTTRSNIGAGGDLNEYYCLDCEKHFDNIDAKLFKCHNGRVVIVGYQVVMREEQRIDDLDTLHPKIDNFNCLLSLSQANKIIEETDNGTWELDTIYIGTIEEPVIMFVGKNPRI